MRSGNPTGAPRPRPDGEPAGVPTPRARLTAIGSAAIAAAALIGAHELEGPTKALRGKEPLLEQPFAPSASTAPFVSLGYREAMADALSLRLRGYFGGSSDQASGSADLMEAILALDPQYLRMYEYGARAVTMADAGVGNASTLRAIAALERGAKEFPTNWKIPYLAGQLYTLELETQDPVLRRSWDERGTLLIESAIRKPGASAEAATFAAHMRTKLGQHEAAVAGLREMLLVTRDDKARQRMIDKLALLEQQDAAEIGAEVLGERMRFEAEWKTTRPAMPPTMYVLIGPKPSPVIDFAKLAAGGRDLVGAAADDAAEPLR
jgi:hypothetical protein